MPSELRRKPGVAAGRVASAAAVGAALLAVGLSPASALPGPTEAVSLNDAGQEANAGSAQASASGDGRFVVFTSTADNLVEGDTNALQDVFVRDLIADVTARVNVDSEGNQAILRGSSGAAFSPAISADGRYVTFQSNSPDLVEGDTNDNADIFVHDRQTGVTERVSVSSTGAEALGQGQIFMTGDPSISADGRFVAFVSAAINLVESDTNGQSDVFVHDRTTGQTERVNLSGTGAQSGFANSPDISGDGRFVAFASPAADLVEGDTNGLTDVFVRDRQTGTNERGSVTSAGVQSGGGFNPAISADGRVVAFQSGAGDLVAGDTNAADDIFAHHRTTGETERVSVTSADAQSGGANSPDIGGDGRLVTFGSSASDLVAGDTNGRADIFVHDRQSGTTTLESVGASAEPANGPSLFPALSDDGTVVAFETGATNLAPGANTTIQKVLVHSLASDTTITTTVPETTSTTVPETTTTAPTTSTTTTSTAPTTSSSTSSTIPSTSSTTSTTLSPVEDPCANPTIVGIEGDDMIMGTPGDDVIAGLGGDDFIIGGGGNDIICGGDGNDTITGDAGDDMLFGGAGNDVLRGGAGNDTSDGGEGDDIITEGAGDDILLGGTGNDTLRGGSGNDSLDGGDGDDRLLGEDGNDTLDGGGGANRLNGGAGTDACGGAGTNALKNCEGSLP